MSAKSWTEGKLYQRKDGELAEFVGMREYDSLGRVTKAPVFRHSNGQELMHYWNPVIPFVSHDFAKDLKDYGHMCIVDDDTQQPSCC
jgi:hypothetical protein